MPRTVDAHENPGEKKTIKKYQERITKNECKQYVKVKFYARP